MLWFEGKSGHLECVETVGSGREVLGWLLPAQLDCKMAETGNSKGSCRLLALSTQNRNTLSGPPCHTMPCYSLPPPDAVSVENASASIRPPLAQRDPTQLQGPATVNPALSYRNMPISSHYPHFVVHHDQPISASSLDRRRGREKLGRKERRSSYEGCMNLDIGLSVRPKVSVRLAHSRSFPSSGVSAANPVAGVAQLANPQQIPQVNAPGRALVMILPLRFSAGPCNQDGYDMCCGNGKTHQEAPNASSTCGTQGAVRKKPGCVVVGHFCDWLLCISLYILL
jgi:hypothetical protein